MRRYLLLFIIALCALVSACSDNDDNSYQGYIEGRYTYIASQVSGELTELYVEEGDKVKRGQSLFMLNKQPQAAAVKQAQANLEHAKSNLANLELGKRPSEIAAIIAQVKQVKAKLIFSSQNVIRYKKLASKDFVSKQRYEQSLSEFKAYRQQLKQYKENLATAYLPARINEIKQAIAKVDAQQAALKQAQWQLSQKVITAPADGLVFETLARVGDTMAANSPVLSMLTPNNIRVIFFVPEPMLSKIQLGESIFFIQGSKTYQAKIFFISPQAEYTPPVIYSRTRMDELVYRIEAHVPRQQALSFHPGQPVMVKLHERK